MAIMINVDVMMAKRKMIVESTFGTGWFNIEKSVPRKTGKAKAIRFSTLKAICKALDCQPDDILFFDTYLLSLATV